MFMHIFLFFKSFFQPLKLDNFQEKDLNTCKFNIYLGKYLVGDIFLSEKEIIVLIRKGNIRKMNLNKNFFIFYDETFLEIFYNKKKIIQFLISNENFKKCDGVLNGKINKIT